jgi:hypothetical protein
VPYVHLVPEDVGKHHFGEVLLLLVSVQVAIFELCPDVSHLAVDPLLLELAHTTCSEVGDVLIISWPNGEMKSGQSAREAGLGRGRTWVRPLIDVAMVGSASKLAPDYAKRELSRE